MGKTQARTGYEKWQDTVDTSQADDNWDGYDDIIQGSVNEFNTRLKDTPGYRKLDWRLIKAMVWTESGGPRSPDWKTRPIQIGNVGDPGLHALLNEARGSVILTPALKATFKKGVSNPETNIKAGIAYLLMRAVTIAHRSVPDTSDSAVHEVQVGPGDTLERIARANATTVDSLTTMNAQAKGTIKPGQKLTFRKAAIQPVITGWHLITPHFAAQNYNVGDANYEQKLNYCLKLIGQ